MDYPRPGTWIFSVDGIALAAAVMAHSGSQLAAQTVDTLFQDSDSAFSKLPAELIENVKSDLCALELQANRVYLDELESCYDAGPIECPNEFQDPTSPSQIMIRCDPINHLARSSVYLRLFEPLGLIVDDHRAWFEGAKSRFFDDFGLWPEFWIDGAVGLWSHASRFLYGYLELPPLADFEYAILGAAAIFGNAFFGPWGHVEFLYTPAMPGLLRSLSGPCQVGGGGSHLSAEHYALIQHVERRFGLKVIDMADSPHKDDAEVDTDPFEGSF